MKKVEVISNEEYYGYPVVVYDYKNHNKYKDSIIKSARSYNVKDIFTHTNIGPHLTRRRTHDMKDPFFSCDDEGVVDLKRAYYEALNHYYREVLDYEFLCEEDKPQINQSWVMDYMPHPDFNFEQSSALSFHSHFLSFVCGCYYPLFTENNGGELLIHNPSQSVDYQHQVLANGPRQSMHTNFMSEFELRCEKLSRWKEVKIKEGQIVLWYGTLPHGAMPSTDPANRMSIVVNTSPSIVTEKRGLYQFKVEANFPQGTGKWSENSLDK